LPKKIRLPGAANSKRINPDKSVPKKPLNAPNKKYKVPMSLWLVE
jgi:hypothetical protein